MCFSAEASFTAAIVIGSVGCANFLTLNLRKTLALVAFIPILFAIQQFSEGLIWLYLNNSHSDAAILKYMPYVYLIFAFLVWPVYFPLAFWFAEKEPLRKSIILGVLFAGICLDIYYLTLIPRGGFALNIYENSIRYSFPNDGLPYVYGIIGVLPILISSLKKAWVFALLLAIGYFFTQYFFEKTFVSVWCFFGAISTISLYFILRENQLPLTAGNNKEAVEGE